MQNEDIVRLRARVWIGGLLTTLGMTLFTLALFGLAVQFQHNLGVHFFDVPEGAENPLLLLVPLLTLSGIGITLVGMSALAAARNLRRVRSHGLLGTAKVVSATPIDLEIAGRRLIQVDVVVELSGLPPYTASARALPPGPDAALEPGSEFAVRVDPKDEQRIVFV
jgi:hypothetical protein